jgi:hypothetical protein
VAVVTLREVTDGNRHAVLAQRVAPAQERFVGTVAGALADRRATPAPEPFYRRIGFTPTGELDENGEIILALSLDPD